MTDKPLISIIIPVLNEESNVIPLYDELTRVMSGLVHRYEYELIFTDNHSEDETFSIIQALSADDPRVSGYRFSKNFGFQRSILTGYLKASGDAVIQIDADLQDPPDLIPAFIDNWERGYDVVYGIRRVRHEGRLLGWTRSLFYRLIDALSEDDLPHAAGDFRLVSRRIVNLLAEVDDYHPYLRGLIASFGFNQIGVSYDRAPRTRGESKFSFFRLIALALDGILVHSVIPLRIATLVGVATACVMVLGIGGYAISRLLFGHDWPPGFATTTILLLLGIILNGLFLGIIGEYLGRLYQQVKRRPITIVEQQTLGSDKVADSKDIPQGG